MDGPKSFYGFKKQKKESLIVKLNYVLPYVLDVHTYNVPRSDKTLCVYTVVTKFLRSLKCSCIVQNIPA